MRGKTGEQREEKMSRSTCDKCGQHYLLKDGVEQSVLSDAEYDNWKKRKQGAGVYPDLRLELPYTCRECSRNVLESRATHEELRDAESDSRKTSLPSISFWAVIIAILVALSGLWLYTKEESHAKETPVDIVVPKQSQEEKLLDEDIYKLEDMYKKQEERLWYTLLAGIKSVIRENPNQPTVFLMLYDSDAAGNTARCIAKDVIKAASKYLMGRQKEALVYPGRSLEERELLEDPGKLLVRLNSTVREKGSLVVTDLQDVPPRVARGFHFICDKYSPLVQRAVLFFTLSVDRVGPKMQRKAEARLSELWADDMDDSFLHPLITRMTPNILKITSDNYNC